MDQNWEWDEFLDDRSVQARKESAAVGLGKKPASGTKKTSAGTKKTSAGTKKTVSDKSGMGVKKTASGTKKPAAGAAGTRSAGAVPVQQTAPAEGQQERPKKRPATAAGSGTRSGSGTAHRSGSGGTRTRAEGFSNVKNTKKKKRRKKKSKVFWICYAVFVAVLAVALFIIVRSVRKTMEEYKENVPESVIRAHLADLSESDIQTMFVSNPVYESPGEAAANIRAYLADGSDLIIRRADYADRGNEKAYSVHKEGRKLFTTYLRSLEEKSWMDLLSYDVLEFVGYEAEPDIEFFRYEIKAPSVFDVTLNGRALSDPVSSEAFTGFADGADHVTVPTINTYVVDHLTKEAVITVSDGGTQLPVTVSEQMDLTELYEETHTFASTEEAGIDFDAIGFAKQWSMFLRDDLGGNLHGYYQLEPYFIAGTSMEQKAKQWGSSIDITFTSKHTLNNPPFTEEKVTRVVKFDENTAAVDVYLEMHMTLTKTGENRTDVFDSTIYLVRAADGTWKVVNIRGNAENENL